MQSKVSAARRVLRFVWGLTVAVTICFWSYLYVVSIVYPNRDPWTWNLIQDPWLMKTCDWTERNAAESPDGSKRAIVADFACGGFGGAGIWTTVAVIKPGNLPFSGDEILSASNIYETYTRLEWQGNNHLKVILPYNASIWDQNLIHNGVKIEVQFSDPDAREHYLSTYKRKL